MYIRIVYVLQSREAAPRICCAVLAAMARVLVFDVCHVEYGGLLANIAKNDGGIQGSNLPDCIH